MDICQAEFAADRPEEGFCIGAVVLSLARALDELCSKVAGKCVYHWNLNFTVY
jgi:hypothetical protein